MIQFYDQIHEWLMQNGVIPMFYYFGWMDFIEESNRALDWLFLGCMQIILIRFLFRPFEGEPKFELSKAANRMKSIRSDIYYCLFHRLGFFQLFFFFVFNPLFLLLGALLHDYRFERLNFEQSLPFIASQPFLIFLIYLFVLDFVDYIYHRFSHRIAWWWKLHALHHSQKYLTVWSDNRNHFRLMTLCDL
jgi:sterol desaturase/sphingolipid hydroxylase (fatty acid hydroxylase superfamily)